MSGDDLEDALRRLQSQPPDSPRQRKATPSPPSAESTEIARLTRDFVTRMRSVGGPCVGRIGGEDGWRITAETGGFEKYRFVTVSGKWLVHEPVSTDGGGPWAASSVVKEDAPAIAEASRLLAAALIGYGVISAADDARKPLVACQSPADVAAAIDGKISLIFPAAAAAAWSRICGHPAAPRPAAEILDIYCRAHFYGHPSYRVSSRSRAWFAGLSPNNNKTWLDEQGLLRVIADERDRAFPVFRSKETRAVILTTGSTPIPSRSGSGIENGYVLGRRSHLLGSAEALDFVLSR